MATSGPMGNATFKRLYYLAPVGEDMGYFCSLCHSLVSSGSAVKYHYTEMHMERVKGDKWLTEALEPHLQTL